MDIEEKTDLFNEVELLKNFDHPNILKMYEFFEDKNRYFMVTENCSGGELFDQIGKIGNFRERDAAHLIKQVLSCLNYCHLKNVVHRDMKPENILLESSNSADYDRIKITNFSSSAICDPNGKLEEIVGAPYYIAPEVLSRNYNSKCDIWSCGVITYILLCG